MDCIKFFKDSFEITFRARRIREVFIGRKKTHEGHRLNFYWSTAIKYDQINGSNPATRKGFSSTLI